MESAVGKDLERSMRSHPKVSVLLTCWNREDTIQEALKSVVSQDFADREILLVDDGSTDRSISLAEGFPEVKILRNEENRGVVFTRQRALEESLGEYLLYVDSDNRLKPGAISNLVAELEKHSPEVAFVYGQREYFGGRGGLSDFPDFDRDFLKLRNYVDMTSLFRRKPVAEVGFDERFPGLEDYDLVLSLVGGGYSGVLLDKPILEYRVHGASLTGGFNWKRRIDMLGRLARKHRPFFSEDEVKTLIDYNRAKVVNSLRRRRCFRGPLSERWADWCETLRFAGVSRQALAATLYLLLPGWTQKPPRI
ncbi:MAG: glycosyltransferase family A protein [Verrucomicrobiota bacterium]